MTTALTSVKQTPNLGALIEAHGENLANTVDQATEIFKENQAKQKETIDCLTTTVDSLQAELIKARGEIDQLKKAHEAALKAMQVKDAEKTALVSQELDKIDGLSARIAALQKNLTFKFCHDYFAYIMTDDPSFGYGVFQHPIAGYSGNVFGFQQYALNHTDPEFKAIKNPYPFLTLEQFSQESKQAADSIQNHVVSLKKQLKPQTP